MQSPIGLKSLRPALTGIFSGAEALKVTLTLSGSVMVCPAP
jgi:hypothetical protein